VCFPLRKLIAETAVALVAGLVFLPGFASAATATAYFADWPGQKGGSQVGWGLLFGLAAWFLVSFLFLRRLGRPQDADGGAYEQLCVRLRSLRARVNQPDGGILPPHGDHERRREAYGITCAHTRRLEEILLDWSDAGEQPGPREFASGFRWWFAFGYVNLFLGESGVLTEMDEAGAESGTGWTQASGC
jgi:hypothetical protein